MTKNNAFKKNVRAYMESHNVPYAEARRILDTENYLQGTGSITLIVGATGVGKTTALKEFITTGTTMPTAVLNLHIQELEFFRGNNFAGSFKDRTQLRDLVAEKKYSRFAIDDLDGFSLRDDTEHPLDIFPKKADLILTFPTAAPSYHQESVESILYRLDQMNYSNEPLSQRVKTVKYLCLELNDWSQRVSSHSSRLHITDYSL